MPRPSKEKYKAPLKPVLCYYEGRPFVLSGEQWKRLQRRIKGLNGQDKAMEANIFLVEEGKIK